MYFAFPVCQQLQNIIIRGRMRISPGVLDWWVAYEQRATNEQFREPADHTLYDENAQEKHVPGRRHRQLESASRSLPGQLGI
jgi:hypothetical protein